MRLEIPITTTWPCEERGEVRIYTAPGGVANAPDMFVEIHPVLPRTDVSVEALLRSGLAPGVELRREPVEMLETSSGWSIRVEVAGAVVGGQVTEIRAVATYALTVYTGVVVVRSTSAWRFAEHRAHIRSVITSAQPVLAGDEPASISELWAVD